jgi:hypothetical protein
VALIPCGECGKQVSDKATACPHCGNPIAQAVPLPAPLANDTQAEDIAREERERATRFGIPPAGPRRSPGSRTAADGFGGTDTRILPTAILAFLLGFLGVHRFSVGKTGSGVVMVILSITVVGLFVTSMWALVDLVMIVVGSFEDADGRPITAWTEGHGALGPRAWRPGPERAASQRTAESTAQLRQRRPGHGERPAAPLCGPRARPWFPGRYPHAPDSRFHAW